MSISVSTTRILDLSAATLSADVTYYTKTDRDTHATVEDADWQPHLVLNRSSGTCVAMDGQTFTTTIANLRVSLVLLRGSATLFYWSGNVQSILLENPDSGENIIVEVAYGPGFDSWATIGSAITPTSVSNSAYTTVTIDHVFTESTDFQFCLSQTSNSGTLYNSFALKNWRMFPLGDVTISKSVAEVTESGTTDTLTVVLIIAFTKWFGDNE